MSFPQTRHTLIQRIVTLGADRDWQEFLEDYWGPVCRFSRRRGSLTLADAEDVAAATFEALVANRLLARWVSDRAAKLRTLLCGVVRNILSNRARVQGGRERLLREHGGSLAGGSAVPFMTALDVPDEQVDAFYAAWVEEILEQAVESLLTEYHREGKGDYFRVLFGRVCEELSMPEIARALNLPTTTAENYYKHAKQRLARKLEDLVRAHVVRYCPPDEAEAEFSTEWGILGDHLKKYGGLEQAVRRSYEGGDPFPSRKAKAASLNAARARLSGMWNPRAKDAPADDS